MLLHTPDEFWQIPVLKWQLQIERQLIDIEQLKLPEANHQVAVKLAFCKGLQDWQREHPDRDLTDEEYTWWCWYGNEIGALPDNWAINLMCETINNDYNQFIRNVEKMKKDGEIPESLPPLELAALLLNPPETNIGQIPPRHSFWYSLGVKDAGEWHAKGGLNRLITIAKRITANERTYLRLLASKEPRQGASDKLEYVPDYTGLELKLTAEAAEDEIDYLNDNDRLSQFYKRAGIDMATLTDSESSRILDILHALDTGYDFASKRGVSMAAYYGDNADMEKKRRQRLFKKIREASDKPK